MGSLQNSQNFWKKNLTLIVFIMVGVYILPTQDSTFDKEPFKINKLSPIQSIAIDYFKKQPIIPKRAPVAVIAPTGSGKTLAYLFPLLDTFLRQAQSNRPDEVSEKFEVKNVIFAPNFGLQEQISSMLDNFQGLGFTKLVIENSGSLAAFYRTNSPETRIDFLICSLAKWGQIGTSPILTRRIQNQRGARFELHLRRGGLVSQHRPNRHSFKFFEFLF